MQRVILHVDMDAFFASVEQRENPAIRGRPVIVGADPQGGRGRGVVAACSYEARRFGIHSAMPIRKAYQLCPDAVYLRPNGALYRGVSEGVMDIFRRYTDLVEPISVDEAFLDVTGSRRLFGTGREIAVAIKSAVRVEHQLTCSIGIAPNKFLAKIASDLRKPDGLCEVEPGKEKEFLRDLPIRCIWGVGPKTEKRLQEMGVLLIGDVARKGREFWIQCLGAHGEHLWHLSEGLDDRPVHASEGFKSISNETTFHRDTGDVEEVKRAVLNLSEEVARRCRKHSVKAKVVVLKWRWEDFTTLTRQAHLNRPSDDGGDFSDLARRLMSEFLPLGRKVRLVGIGVHDFEAPRSAQPGLFDKSPASEKQKERLDGSIDRINQKFGKGAVKKASLLEAQELDDFSTFRRKT